ncbi:MAG: hypothetical protein JO126_02970 [Alphaproteobacteria bacterium]|nr:hypothetical protein [Alphaproteobacteria bacterium]MBV8548403.1 hypothetical protein [Alphaproteobacteria bacterium]
MKTVGFSEYVRLHINARRAEDDQFIPPAWYKQHTMRDDLYAFVEQKLPTKELEQALFNGIPVEIHGTHPLYATEIMLSVGYTDIEEIHTERTDFYVGFSPLPPRFFWATDKTGQRKLLMAVTPGKDYVAHFAELVRYFCHQHFYDPSKTLQIVRYPDVETELTNWSGLDHGFVTPGDRIIMGHVTELEQEMHAAVAQGEVTLLSNAQNPFYGSKRYRTKTGEVINLVSAHYSYWGNMAGLIAERLCELGASEIIYVSKVGTLTNADDVYSRVFAPVRFAALDREQISTVVQVENTLCNSYPELNSNMHVSVATIMEETFRQREIASTIGSTTIDMETAHIALAIDKWNKNSTTKVRFGSLHFASDYLHPDDKPCGCKTFNLATDKTALAMEKHSVVVSEMMQYMLGHIGLTTLKPLKTVPALDHQLQLLAAAA